MPQTPQKRSPRQRKSVSSDVEGDGTQASKTGQSYGPIAKTVQLLELLADAPPDGMGVRSIARSLGLPVSSVHRLLGVLVGAGIVSRDTTTRQYAIGVEFYRIAARVTRGMKLPDLALPVLQKLAAEFNETALLGLYLEQHGQMMFAERVDGTQALRYQISMLTPLPLVWGASGKAILAYLDPRLVNRIRRSAGKAPGSGSQPPERSVLEAELEVVRRNGYAVTEGEKLPGARGVAAPVFGSGGVAGCLCITSPADRLPTVTVRTLAERLVAEANYLSALCGGSTPDIGALRGGAGT